MSDIEYKGKDGWGVIPAWREKDRPPRDVQQTLFSIYDSLVSPEIPSYEAPVAKETKKKTALRTSSVQANFEFSQIAEGRVEVISAPFPDIQDKRIYHTARETENVKLPDGRILRLPGDFEELRNIYPMNYVQFDNVFYIPEQVRALIIAQESRDRNLFFDADTSFGKTILELLMAACELDNPSARVVLVTPTIDLIRQIEKDAKFYLNLPPQSLLTLSGEVPAARRKDVYNNPQLKLLITTPNIFANDLESAVSPKSFTLALLDEGDLGVGNTGYLKAGSILASAGVLIRAFSATQPDKNFRKHEMLSGFQIETDEVIKLHSPSKKIFRKTTFHQLKDEKMLEAAGKIFNGVASCALELQCALREAVKLNIGILQREQKILTAFEKITKLNKGRFQIPTIDENSRVRNALQKANLEDRKRFGYAYSLMSEFGYRIHLYHTLTRFGKFAFLNSFASDLWSHKFHTPRKKGKKKGKYFERVFDDHNLLKVFESLAKKTLFAKLISPTASLGGIARDIGMESWSSRSQKLRSESVEEGSKPKSFWDKKRLQYAVDVRQAFLNAAALEIAADRNWYDGPVLERLKDLVLRHCTFGRSDQVIAATDSAENALFYPLVINNILTSIEKAAVPFTGMVHLSLEERESNLARFKTGEAEVVVGTSGAIKIGLHSGAAVLICCNQEVTVAGQTQLLGRVGRLAGVNLEAKIAYVYDEICNGTPDFTRFYAGYWRRREEERLSRLKD